MTNSFANVSLLSFFKWRLKTRINERQGSKCQRMHHAYLIKLIISQKGFLKYITEKKQNHFEINFLLISFFLLSLQLVF